MNTEIPKYRVTRETKPAPKARFRTEPPFSSSSESDVWQYGSTTLKAGSTIETREWPNPGSFFPLNEPARRVMDFFTSRQKSRLPRSPYDAAGRLRLDDGLANPPPKIGSLKLPKVEMQPAS